MQNLHAFLLGCLGYLQMAADGVDALLRTTADSLMFWKRS